MRNYPHLCLIIDRTSGAELAEYQPDAPNELEARCAAERLFKHDQRYQPRLRAHTDWDVDVCAL